MIGYKPRDSARRVSAPLLVCVGNRDRETPPVSREIGERAPRGEVVEYPIAHFQVYDRECASKCWRIRSIFCAVI